LLLIHYCFLYKKGKIIVVRMKQNKFKNIFHVSVFFGTIFFIVSFFISNLFFVSFVYATAGVPKIINFQEFGKNY